MMMVWWDVVGPGRGGRKGKEGGGVCGGWGWVLDFLSFLSRYGGMGCMRGGFGLCGVVVAEDDGSPPSRRADSKRRAGPGKHLERKRRGGMWRICTSVRLSKRILSVSEYIST